MAAPITTELIVEQAGRLAEGGHRFTARQLYYATCTAVEQPAASATPGIIGLGALLVVLAGALLWVHSPPLSPILALIGVAVLLLAPLNAHVERQRERERAAEPRVLAESYERFAAGPLERALRERPDALASLLSPKASGETSEREADDRPLAMAEAAEAATTAPARASARSRTGLLIACDRAETARLLAANLDRLPRGTRVIDASAPGWEQAIGPALSGPRRVVALHDADPSGCALPARLRGAGALEVTDAGLVPPPSNAGLQVLEGAPARVPAGLEGDFTGAQVQWLASGRRVELATLSPAEVVALVLAAAPAGTGPADGPVSPAVRRGPRARPDRAAPAARRPPGPRPAGS